MNASQGLLAQFFLRYASSLAGLRRVPVVGRCVSWAGAKLVPRDSLAWVQVQKGPAQGLWLHLNPRTGQNYFEGGGEPEVQEALQQNLRPGMTFYDIGANIGFFSLLAARLVGKEGRVVAFEADPEVAARLREHVARNSFGWITVEEKAVWSEPRAVFFARTDPATSPDRGLGHVVPVGAGDTIQVDAVPLDDYTCTQPAADFLKCDVEGAEVEVFRGARRLLKEKRPGVICEMHSEENNRILIEEFSRLGYNCKACGAGHILALPE
ncbi:MAG TPA: FkbM family methyltransferase [Candidatus Acidoferrum sp.]|nr:FkbM family methyltransferase [Candidatus Acidoferrum sp.]